MEGALMYWCSVQAGWACTQGHLPVCQCSQAMAHACTARDSPVAQGHAHHAHVGYKGQAISAAILHTIHITILANFNVHTHANANCMHMKL